MVRFRDRNSETVFRMSADAVPAHFHAAVREARRAGVAVRKDSDADVVEKGHVYIGVAILFKDAA